MSSRTPVRCENSCSTPSILTQVGAEPALDIILNLRKLVTPQNRKMNGAMSRKRQPIYCRCVVVPCVTPDGQHCHW